MVGKANCHIFSRRRTVTLWVLHTLQQLQSIIIKYSFHIPKNFITGWFWGHPKNLHPHPAFRLPTPGLRLNWFFLGPCYPLAPNLRKIRLVVFKQICQPNRQTTQKTERKKNGQFTLPDTDRKSSTEVMSSTASVRMRTCFSHWSLNTSMLSWATLLWGRAASVRAALITWVKVGTIPK